MTNLLSNCGLVDARISASDKDLSDQYMKTTNSEHVVYINCSECENKNNLCTQHVLSLQFSCTELVIQ